MTVTPDQVVAKRLRVEQLRREISMLEQAKATDAVVADLAVQDRALDEEIQRLERERSRAGANAPEGGSVAEALAAMALAEQDAMAPSSRPSVGETQPSSDVVTPVPDGEASPPVVIRPAIDTNKTEGEGN